MAQLTFDMQPSFAAGELAEELHARVDLEKFRVGLKTCKNFKVRQTGGVENRAGFVFVGEAGDSTRKVRIVPFSFNNTQTYILEFGHQYLRVFKDGAHVVETSVDTLEGSNAVEVSGTMQMRSDGALPGTWTAGKHCYLTGASGTVYGPYLIDSTSTPDVFLTELDGSLPNVLSHAASVTDLQTADTTMELVYQIATTYTESELFDIKFAQSADVMTLVHPSHPVRELTRTGHAAWTLSAVTFGTGVSTPGSVSATATAGSGSFTYSYKVTAVEDGEESVPSSAATCTNTALAAPSAYNTVTWGSVAGAEFYNVYKKRGGAWGFVGQATSTSFVDDGIVADLTDTPPDAQTVFGSSDNYPSVVGFYQQRRLFGGTNNNVNKNWASQTGNFANFNKSQPTKDDDAISFVLAEQKVNNVRHYVGLEHLILLTEDAAWRVTGTDSDALTPSSIAAKPQEFTGVSTVAPLVVKNNVLFISAEDDTVHTLNYEFTTNSYSGNDLTVLSRHLFDTYTLVDWAHQRHRDSVVWVVRSDGKLLGLTYLPEHDVWAWHRHDTDGEFESVAVIREDGLNRLWAVVKRHVNGRDVRYIERMHTRLFDDAKDGVFMDSALCLVNGGSALTEIRGLEWLEGKTVGVLVEGRVQPQKLVDGGAVSVDVGANETVCVGLAYECDLESLPIDPNQLVGVKKHIPSAEFRVLNTRGIKVGPSSSDLVEVPPTITNYDTAPSLFSGDIDANIVSGWQDHGTLFVRQDNPLPATIVAFLPRVMLGG